MEKERASQLLFFVGIGVLALSFAWPWIVGGKRAWSEEDAETYTKASSDLHNVQARASHEDDEEGDGHHHHGDEEPATKEDVDSVKQQFDEIQAKRDAALSRGQTTSFIGKLVAGGLLLAGCVFRFLQHREENA